MTWEEIFRGAFPDGDPAALVQQVQQPQPAPVMAQEERYEDVEDYDPVLRSHCRL